MLLPRTSRAATEPAMAATEPTEMSMPPVAMTRVMPRAMIRVGEARFRMSIRLPNRWPSFTETLKKSGVTIRLNSRMIARASRGQARGLTPRRERPAATGLCSSIRGTLQVPFGDGVHDDPVLDVLPAQGLHHR